MTNSFMDRVWELRKSIADNLKYFSSSEIERALLVAEMAEKLKAIDDARKTHRNLDLGDGGLINKIYEILNDTKE